MEAPLADSHQTNTTEYRKRSPLKTLLMLVTACAAGFFLHFLASIIIAPTATQNTSSTAQKGDSGFAKGAKAIKSLLGEDISFGGQNVTTQDTTSQFTSWIDAMDPDHIINIDARNDPKIHLQKEAGTFVEFKAMDKAAYLTVETGGQVARLTTEDDHRLHMTRFYDDIQEGFSYSLKLHHARKLRFVYTDKFGNVWDKCYIDGNGNNNVLNFTGAHTCHPEAVEGLEVGQCVYMTGEIKNLEELGDWEALPIVRGDGTTKKFYGIYLEYIEGDTVTFHQGSFANDVAKTDERIWVGAHGNMVALAYPDSYTAGDYLIPDGKYLRKSATPGAPSVRCVEDKVLTEVGRLGIEM